MQLPHSIAFCSADHACVYTEELNAPAHTIVVRGKGQLNLPAVARKLQKMRLTEMVGNGVTEWKMQIKWSL